MVDVISVARLFSIKRCYSWVLSELCMVDVISVARLFSIKCLVLS